MVGKNKNNLSVNMKKTNKKIFLIINLIILILGFTKGFHKPFYSLYLFTRQTILLTNIYFVILYLPVNYKIKKYLSFICLIDCLLLLFYNFKIENQHFYNQRNSFAILVANLEHILLPLIFLYYYFFLDKTVLTLQFFYIGLIHPFLYLMLCIICHKSPYQIIKFNISLNNLLFYGIIFSLISIVSLILIQIKNKIIKNNLI